MPSVQSKGFPEHTHAVLRARAAAAHQSLQEYQRPRLVREASISTVDEVLDRAGRRRSGGVSVGRRRGTGPAGTVFVVDVSALAPALADDSADDYRARAALRGEDLTAPGLLDL